MPAGSRQSPKSIVWVTIIVLVGLAIRIMAIAHWGTGAIESEGTEYARIAQNLRSGIGYVGLTSPGLELVFPPLYPFLIAVASFLTPDYEWAGRIVSLTFQTLLPLPVFGIASLLYGRRTGFAAAILIILSPLLVNLSFMVLSEAIYLPLILTATYLVLLALNSSSTRHYCVLGLVFGLAYLTRQEAVASLLIALFLTVCLGKGSTTARCKRAAAALALFSAVALPEVVYLYHATGQIRLEAKSPIFFMEQVRSAIARQNHEAIPEEWAEHAIDADLQRTGTKNRPEADVIRDTTVHSSQATRNLKMGMRQNIPIFLAQLDSRWLGGPFLPALAFLGAVRRPWRRRLFAGHLFVVLVPLAAVAATFSFSGWTDNRYYFLLIPFLSIWAASGLVALGAWAKASAMQVGWPRFAPEFMQWAAPGVIVLLLALYPISGVRSLYDLQQDSRRTQYVKQMGSWIREQGNHPATIMDLSTPLAFYAGANWVHFPYCDGSLALRFLDAAKVDYVVLRQSEKYTPYYQDWVTHGIPDPRAEPIYQRTDSEGTRITLVRWHHQPTP